MGRWGGLARSVCDPPQFIVAADIRLSARDLQAPLSAIEPYLILFQPTVTNDARIVRDRGVEIVETFH